jgi:AraC family transcriptional regulator
MSSAVERAIECMWERYDEPLALSDIAQSAILSRFHFARIFKGATGVSPGRFLSAVRIYQAKRMLLNTSMRVTDISFSVGYNSLGSFTNHFTDSVGVSPGQFRRMPGRSVLGPWAPAGGTSRGDGDGTVAGTISLPAGYVSARVYLGAFDTPIVQRRPAAATIVAVGSPAEVHTYRLTNVPAGTWFIHAVAVADSADPEPWRRRSVLIGRRNPVRVDAGTGVLAPISLQPRQPADLPILLALPDLESAPDDLSYEAAMAQAADQHVALDSLSSPA